MLEGYYIKKIGQNRGIPRVWLEGTQTERAGFKPGQKFDVVVQGHTIVLQANPDGSRVVSSKKAGEKQHPVIDLNSRELLAIFDGMSAVRVAVKKGEIYLLPLASEIKKRERFNRLREKLESGEPLTVGSVSHGGGVLSHAIHTGLKEAGIATKIGFANEIRGDLLEHAAVHNDAWSDDTKVFAAPMQELAFDDRGVAQIPRVEICELGLPCSGASKAGIARRGLAHPEAHPEVGHLVVSALMILSKANAAVVILENVPNYANSASADILRNQLRDMGYVTHERILNGKQWGTLENRDRWCMIAVTEGIEFNFDHLQPPATRPRRLGDALDPIAPDDPRWSRMEGLKAKEQRDLAEGKGFRMQVFNADSEHVGTLTKGYAKVRSTDPKLAHPTNPDLLRQLTPAEHARIKAVPEHLVDGLSETIAHEVLGQSIVYPPFRDVGHHVGNALNRVVGKAEVPLGDRATVAAPEIPDEVSSLAREVVATFRLADAARGQYSGVIVAVDRDVMIQDVGRGEGVIHRLDLLNKQPRLGQTVKIAYEKGRAKVEEKVRAPQMALSL